MEKELKKSKKVKSSTKIQRKPRKEKVTVEKTITKYNKTIFGKFVKLCLYIGISLIFIALIIIAFKLYIAAQGININKYQLCFDLADLFIDKGGFLLLISLMCYAFAMPSIVRKDKETKKNKENESSFIIAFRSPSIQSIIIMLMTFYIIYICYEIGLIFGL